MVQRRNRVVLCGLLLGAGSITAGCGGNSDPQQATVHRAIVTYTCCAAADVDPVRHPGDVVLVHWTTSSEPSSQPAHPISVTLTAALAGPYDTVMQLKGGVSAHPSSPIARAAPVKTTDQASGTPVSRIVIPSDARDGFYELQFSIREGGGIVSSGSVIHVTTR